MGSHPDFLFRVMSVKHYKEEIVLELLFPFSWSRTAGKCLEELKKKAEELSLDVESVASLVAMLGLLRSSGFLEPLVEVFCEVAGMHKEVEEARKTENYTKLRKKAEELANALAPLESSCKKTSLLW